MTAKSYDEIIISSLIFTLPISIIIGPSVSLINIVFINIILIKIFFERKFSYLFNSSTLKILLAIYIYLIFNTFISESYEIGFVRNLGFIRFIGLFILINYFFYTNNFSLKIFSIWTFVLMIVIIDVYLEYFLGSNIFGWGATEPHAQRIVSFFKDEPVAGSFLYGFILVIFGYLLVKFKDKKIIAFSFLLLGFIAVFITGERSNTIKLFFGIILMLFLFDFYKFKIKISILFLIIFIISIFISQSSYLKNRYIGQFLSNIDSLEKIKVFEKQNIYFKHYKSGIEVFKNNFFFGVGNKNYRIETCKNLNFNTIYICTTHPHQIYLELLSEHGLFGSIILISLIFILMFKILKEISISKNYIQIGALIFTITVFTPILPSGSFFSDFNSTIFWTNLSIMFACSRNSNIFQILLNNKNEKKFY